MLLTNKSSLLEPLTSVRKRVAPASAGDTAENALRSRDSDWTPVGKGQHALVRAAHLCNSRPPLVKTYSCTVKRQLQAKLTGKIRIRKAVQAAFSEVHMCRQRPHAANSSN